MFRISSGRTLRLVRIVKLATARRGIALYHLLHFFVDTQFTLKAPAENQPHNNSKI